MQNPEHRVCWQFGALRQHPQGPCPCRWKALTDGPRRPVEQLLEPCGTIPKRRLPPGVRSGSLPGASYLVIEPHALRVLLWGEAHFPLPASHKLLTGPLLAGMATVRWPAQGPGPGSRCSRHRQSPTGIDALAAGAGVMGHRIAFLVDGTSASMKKGHLALRPVPFAGVRRSARCGAATRCGDHLLPVRATLMPPLLRPASAR